MATDDTLAKVRDKRGGYIRFGRSSMDWRLRQKRDIDDSKDSPLNRKQQFIMQSKRLDPGLENTLDIVRLYKALEPFTKKRIIKFGKRFMKYGKQQVPNSLMFGKDNPGIEEKKTYIRFGRNNKEKKQYIRFGRSQ